MTTTLPAPFGKYFLLEKIATGGMAEVFKAKTFGVDGFEKEVCIKKILSHWASDPEFIQMLVDEAKLSASLTHPNIVQVLDLGSFENTHFIAMEFVDGFDLKTLMAQTAEKGQKIPVEIACYIAQQSLAGLDYAHKKADAQGKALEVIHRDVSPHNILLSQNGEVKITDFGIAKATQKQSFTATGMLRGKYSYMSPEQVRCEALSGKSDVFSLGIVLFEMLTGKKCFPGDSEIVILDKIRSSQISTQDIPSDIPEKLRQIVAKALSQNPQERYDAEKMQVDLAQFLATIKPGFLAKDLAKYLAPFTRPRMNHNEPTLNQTQITSNTGSKASVSNSMPPLAPAKKQGSTVLIILMVLFFLFILFVGGGYAAWVFVVKPKLNSSLALDDKMNKANQQIQSIQKSAEDLIKKTQDPQQQALQDQINAAQQAAQNALNNPELQKQIQDAQNAANQLLNQANQQLNNTIANAPLANAPTAAPSAQIPTQQNLTNNTTPPDATAPATVTASPDAATNPNTAQQVQSLPSAVPAQTPSNATPTNNASATANNQAQVLISSNPQGAKISINDVANGLSTPASLSNLLLNTQYKIKLEKAGYYTLEGFFTPTTSTLQEFNFPMKELPAAPKKVKSKAPREDGDFRLKQRPPPGVGGYNNNSFRSGGYGY